MAETIRNADLCALLDGECDAGARIRLEAGLARSPQCAARLALWRRNDAALRLAVFGARPASPMREPLAILPVPPPPARTPPDDAAPTRATRAIRAGLAGGIACSAIALAVILFG